MPKNIAVKFYADKPGNYSNKFFCFGCNDIKQIAKILFRFKENGNIFRAVFVTDYKKEKNYKLNEATVLEMIWQGSEGKQSRIYEGVPSENIQDALKIASEAIRKAKQSLQPK